MSLIAARLIAAHRPQPATEPAAREADEFALLAVRVIEQAVADLRSDAWFVSQARRSPGHATAAKRVRQDAADFLARRVWEDDNLWGAWLRPILPPRPMLLERVAKLQARRGISTRYWTVAAATPLGQMRGEMATADA